MHLVDAKTFIKWVRISRRTLQYWEKAGKIVPQRTPSGRKWYNEEHYRIAMGIPPKEKK